MPHHKKEHCPTVWMLFLFSWLPDFFWSLLEKKNNKRCCSLKANKKLATKIRKIQSKSLENCATSDARILYLNLSFVSCQLSHVTCHMRLIRSFNLFPIKSYTRRQIQKHTNTHKKNLTYRPIPTTMWLPKIWHMQGYQSPKKVW